MTEKEHQFNHKEKEKERKNKWKKQPAKDVAKADLHEKPQNSKRRGGGDEIRKSKKG